MIKLDQIKPIPCLPGASVVVVDAGETPATPPAESAPENLIPAGEWEIGGGWTDNGDGSFSSNQATGYNGITSPLIDLVDGALYLIRVRCVAKTSGTVSPFLGTSGGAESSGTQLQWWGTSAGLYSAWFHIRNSTGGPASIHIRAENGFIGTIDQISLKLLSLP